MVHSCRTVLSLLCLFVAHTPFSFDGGGADGFVFRGVGLTYVSASTYVRTDGGGGGSASVLASVVVVVLDDGDGVFVVVVEVRSVLQPRYHLKNSGVFSMLSGVLNNVSGGRQAVQ